YCSVTGHFQDNETVTIGYEQQTGWYIHSQNFQLLKNSRLTSLPTEVFIDRDRIFNGSGTLGDNNDVRISIGQNPILERSRGNGKFKIIGPEKSIAQKFSEGNSLRFVINNSSEPYSMSGTRKAIKKITECIRSTEISGSGVDIIQETPIAEPRIEDQEPQIDITEFTRSLQLELKRVGCDPGAIDGEWGNKTQSAWDRFNKFANLDLTIGQPTEFALETIQSYNKKVCPVSKNILANKNIQLPQTQIPKKSKCRFPSSNACIQNCMSTGSSVHQNAHFRCVSECQQSGC
ncbi:MAG: peptidoglycan-binding domain-containing protein, partial [Desulfobulbia bacterium]